MMPFFLVCPRQAQSIHVLSMTRRRLRSQERLEQVEEVTQLRRDDPADLEIRRYLKEEVPDRASLSSAGPLPREATTDPQNATAPTTESERFSPYGDSPEDARQPLLDPRSGDPESGKKFGEDRVRIPKNLKLSPATVTAELIALELEEWSPRVVNRSGITGIYVIEMSFPQARKMAEQLPQAVVIENCPLHLIEPHGSAKTKKGSVDEGDLWHLDAIGLTRARKRGFSGTGKGITVAVLDTGIAQHPEISKRIVGNYRLDDNHGSVEHAPAGDTRGHGTHVAGLICGSMVGVAPMASVINCTAVPAGKGSLAGLVIALEWAAKKPQVGIINLSAGIPSFVNDMQTAIDGAFASGVLTVTAIGNEGRDKTRSPGNYSTPLSVGAYTKDGRVAGFSGGGTMIVRNQLYVVPDLVAPGATVYSCVADGGYEAWSGTSMAAPIVSGVAALVCEKYSKITVTELVDELLHQCQDLRFPRDRQGHGLIKVI